MKSTKTADGGDEEDYHIRQAVSDLSLNSDSDSSEGSA